MNTWASGMDLHPMSTFSLEYPKNKLTAQTHARPAHTLAGHLTLKGTHI